MVKFVFNTREPCVNTKHFECFQWIRSMCLEVDDVCAPAVMALPQVVVTSDGIEVGYYVDNSNNEITSLFVKYVVAKNDPYARSVIAKVRKLLEKLGKPRKVEVKYEKVIDWAKELREDSTGEKR